MALRAKKPEKKESRLKMFVYGEAGVGKTLQALMFPHAYIIDTERGTSFYHDTITKQKSVVLQTLNPDEVKEELRELLTTKHDYKTLIIDPITQVYGATQEKWTRIFEKYAKNQKDGEVQDFGMRYWAKVKGDFKALQRIILALDMNVIVTAHQKDVYGLNFSKIGVTYDSMKGDDYFFDLIFRITKKDNKRIAETIKERADMGANKFPDNFEWSYENFCKFYGKEIIEKEATPIKMATDEQIAKLNQLIEIVKIEEDEINRWLTKADCDSFDEFTEEQILKCIVFVEAKLKKLEPKPAAEKKGK